MAKNSSKRVSKTKITNTSKTLHHFFKISSKSSLHGSHENTEKLRTSTLITSSKSFNYNHIQIAGTKGQQNRASTDSKPTSFSSSKKQLITPINTTNNFLSGLNDSGIQSFFSSSKRIRQNKNVGRKSKIKKKAIKTTNISELSETKTDGIYILEDKATESHEKVFKIIDEIYDDVETFSNEETQEPKKKQKKEPNTKTLKETIKESMKERINAKESSFNNNNILSVLLERSSSISHRRMRVLRSLTPSQSHYENIQFNPNNYTPNLKPISRILRERSFVNNRISSCRTVQFSSTNKSQHTNNSQLGNVTSMEFDSKGILLAVSYSRGAICVYDFDELNALDLKCRNAANNGKVVEFLEEARKGKNNVDSESTKMQPKHGCEQQPLQATFNNPTVGQSIIPAGKSKPSFPISNLKYITKSLQTVLQLQTKKHVNQIKWNPDDENQLAVSFMCNHEVKLFDLGARSQRTTSLATSDSRDNNEGNTSLLFLSMKPNFKVSKITGNQIVRRNTRLLVGSNCGVIRMWAIYKEKQKFVKAKTLWSVKVFPSQLHSSTEAVSDIVLLGSDFRNVMSEKDCQKKIDQYKGFLLVGSNKGTIALIDTNRCVRKAFSTNYTPTILRRYSIAKLLMKAMDGNQYTLPPDSSLGIKKINLWSGFRYAYPQNLKEYAALQDSSLTGREHLADQMLRLSNVSVVLCCGWAAQIVLGFKGDDCKDVGLITAYHKTNRILSINKGVDNEYVRNEKLVWSLPVVPCPGWPMENSGILCIGDVPQQLDIQPDRDQRVSLSSLKNEIEDRENAILLVDTDRKMYSPFSFPTADNGNSMDVVHKIIVRDTPSEIIVHPCEEWIVVSYSCGGLELFATRHFDGFDSNIKI